MNKKILIFAVISSFTALLLFYKHQFLEAKKSEYTLLAYNTEDNLKSLHDWELLTSKEKNIGQLPTEYKNNINRVINNSKSANLFFNVPLILYKQV